MLTWFGTDNVEWEEWSKWGTSKGCSDPADWETGGTGEIKDKGLKSFEIGEGWVDDCDISGDLWWNAEEKAVGWANKSFKVEWGSTESWDVALGSETCSEGPTAARLHGFPVIWGRLSEGCDISMDWGTSGTHNPEERSMETLRDEWLGCGDVTVAEISLVDWGTRLHRNLSIKLDPADNCGDWPNSEVWEAGRTAKKGQRYFSVMNWTEQAFFE